MKKQIWYPFGAGGNHIRWLMYFDKSFDKMHFSVDKSPDDKLKFIETNIYPKERTWHNWLSFEWKHRIKFNHIISIDSRHHLLDDGHALLLQDENQTKAIILSFNDYTECIKRYLVIFTQQSPWSLPRIKEEIYDTYNNHIKSKTNSSFQKIIPSDVIWEDVLDKKFYYDIIDFWGFEDHYEYAAKVHTLWVNCQKQALSQFMESCKNYEYINFLKV